MIFKTLIPLTWLLILSLNCHSKVASSHYALLVGVGEYPNIEQLEGPKNDVDALANILIQNWSFKPKNILRLLDEQATKKNILDALHRLSEKVTSGDHFFIYFSGHGTSYFDQTFNLPLPPLTGAFLPYEVDPKHLDTSLDSIIIGNRDLKPILMALDNKKANIFVAMDACFSGNSVRGKYAKITLPKRNSYIFRKHLSKQTAEILRRFSTESSLSYPYQSIYYLAASSAYEAAQDIPTRYLDFFNTLDGLPHGAFTDSLLYALHYPSQADLDRDTSLTYSELNTFIANRMQTKGFSHSPSALPTLSMDKALLLRKPLFGETIQAEVLGTGHTNKQLTYPSIESTLTKVYRQASRPSLENQTLLINKAGDLIAKLENPSKSGLTSTLENQKIVSAFFDKLSVNYPTLAIEFIQPSRSSNLFLGQKIGFATRLKEPGYLLMFSIDVLGKINILYPYMLKEVYPLPADKTHVFSNIIQATPPVGIDQLFAFSFSHWDESLEPFMGQPLSVDTPMGEQFLKKISGSNTITGLRNSAISVFPRPDTLLE